MTDFRVPSSPSAQNLLETPAFEEAYLNLTRYAYTRTRNREEAEEVVSDTVLSFVRDVQAGKQVDNPTGYLRRMFDRRLCDYLRRKYRREAEVSDDGTILNLVPDESDSEELPRSQKETEAVRKALGRLSALYREVVYREVVPEFESMGVLHRTEQGEIQPDIPALSFAEWDRWEAALHAMTPTLTAAIGQPIRELVVRTVNRIPDHVDGREAFLHNGALGCLIPATMKALVDNGSISHVEIGKTPVILVMVQPASGQEMPS